MAVAGARARLSSRSVRSTCRAPEFTPPEERERERIVVSLRDNFQLYFSASSSLLVLLCLSFPSSFSNSAPLSTLSHKYPSNKSARAGPFQMERRELTTNRAFSANYPGVMCICLSPRARLDKNGRKKKETEQSERTFTRYFGGLISVDQLRFKYLIGLYLIAINSVKKNVKMFFNILHKYLFFHDIFFLFIATYKLYRIFRTL